MRLYGFTIVSARMKFPPETDFGHSANIHGHWVPAAFATSNLATQKKIQDCVMYCVQKN